MSLRTRVIAVVVLVALLPVPVVVALGLVGRARESEVARATREAVTDVLDRDGAWDRAARARLVRLRVLDARGSVLADCDHDPRMASYGGVRSIEIGDPAEARDADDVGGRLGSRTVVLEARAGRLATSCVEDEGGALLVCESAAVDPAGRVVHAQRSARSAAQRLSGAARPLGLLTLGVLVSGLLLALWLVVRIVGPLEALRSALAARADKPQLATEPVAIASAPPEIEAVVTAHNRVLATLATERSAREVLAADLVHELKSPLSAIRVALEQGRGDERVESAARQAVARIDRTVGMLLELSRAETGLAGEAREDVPLRALLEGVCGAFAERGGASIEIEGNGGSARVAASSLGRALSCLLDNARSFARERVLVRLVEEANALRIEIEDDGPGVPRELEERVFERVFSARREQGGTGVGLALARAVAEAHGGTLTLRSDVDRGATFVLRLPR